MHYGLRPRRATRDLTVAPACTGSAPDGAPSSDSAGCGLDRSPDPALRARSRGARLLLRLPQETPRAATGARKTITGTCPQQAGDPEEGGVCGGSGTAAGRPAGTGRGQPGQAEAPIEAAPSSAREREDGPGPLHHRHGSGEGARQAAPERGPPGRIPALPEETGGQ